MKVYITTYCLTKGIIEADLRRDGIFYFGKLPGSTVSRYWDEGEVFEDPEDAKKDCHERRSKKIKSLEKQIEKLKSMTF